MQKNKVIKNTLLKANPKVAKEWDIDKNKLDLKFITPNTHKKAWWKCAKGHSWEASVASRNNGRGCPFCSGKKAGYGNDLKTNYPKLIKEWDFKKNKKKPEEFSKFSNNKVWWKCNKGHSWETTISNRSYSKTDCPFCIGKLASIENNLKTQYPKLIKEWDFDKNEKNPEDFTFSSNKKVFWVCRICKESFSTSIQHRTKQNSGCPFCSNQKVRKSNNPNFPNNSLQDLYPDIAEEWDPVRNTIKASDVLSKSHKFAYWICKEAEHSWKARVDSRLLSGCPYCKLTPRRKDELYLLFELKIFFNVSEGDNKIKLHKLLDVDIKLPDEKIVIEYDGAYWHKDKAIKDISKTVSLKKAGWSVIRVREHPLDILDSKFNVHSKSGEYKSTTNVVLKKIEELGFKINNLEEYLNKEKLVNKKEADRYISKLLKEKFKK